MSSNRLCGVCGKSFSTGKSERASSKLKRPVCSTECSEMARGKLNKCVPGCADHTKRFRDVEFSNGTKHCQEYCENCFKTRMVPRSEYAPIIRDYQSYLKGNDDHEVSQET